MQLNIERIAKNKADILKTKNDLLSIIASDKETFLLDNRNTLSLKYLLIQAVEAISDTCQHILAKIKGITCDGYVDCIVKAGDNGLITNQLANKLRRLSDLRNSLIHRYWIIDNEELYDITKENIYDFEEFVEQIDSFIKELVKEI
jgi:uncharacterized protein YutE (UPF0331/DUF86 family)